MVRRITMQVIQASLCFFSLDDAGLGLLAGMLVADVMSGTFLVWLVRD
jgi:hypothetical protein